MAEHTTLCGKPGSSSIQARSKSLTVDESDSAVSVAIIGAQTLAQVIKIHAFGFEVNGRQEIIIGKTVGELAKVRFGQNFGMQFSSSSADSAGSPSATPQAYITPIWR